jgi:DNA/RNA endonuclease YhcR with UshA esterase domain
MKMPLWFVVVAVFAMAAAAVPVLAHHSFAAEFDRNKPVTLTGSVTKVEWANPHARFFIDVKDENGKVNNWDFELASPNGLMRRGWTRNSLKPGDVVTVSGWAAKNAPYVGNTSTVTLADGRKVFAGSSAENETNP